MRYLTHIFLAGLMLLVVGCGQSLEEKLAEAGVVSLNEIVGDFYRNSVTAELKYEDENLTISGQVDHIGAVEDSRIIAGSHYILIRADKGFVWVYCQVDLSDITTLETGNFIIVNGIFRTEAPEWVGYGTDYSLEGCSIVTDQYIGIE